MRKKLIVLASAKCTNANKIYLPLTLTAFASELAEKEWKNVKKTNKRLNEWTNEWMCFAIHMNKKRDLSIECCTWIYVSESLDEWVCVMSARYA